MRAVCAIARGAAPLHSPIWEHSSHTLRGEGAPPLRPRVTFSPMRKSPKNLQGLRPLESPEGGTLSPLRQAAPPMGISATKIDRFATLGLWANRSCFFLWFLRGDISCCQSVARQVSCPEDAAGLFCPQPKPLGQRAGGSKGAEVKAERFYFRPLRRGSRDQEVPGVSLPTFSTRESRPGHGAERPYTGARGRSPSENYKTSGGGSIRPRGTVTMAS